MIPPDSPKYIDIVLCHTLTIRIPPIINAKEGPPRLCTDRVGLGVSDTSIFKDISLHCTWRKLSRIAVLRRKIDCEKERQYDMATFWRQFRDCIDFIGHHG